MKKYFTLLLVLGISGSTFAQKQLTREAFIRFYSETPVENIEATTKEASSVIDFEKGEFVCQVLMKSFLFEKALMQEHFNENYVESEKYPKAVFKGAFQDWPGAKTFKADGDHKLKVTGTMSIHGVEQPLETDCVLTIKDGKASLSAEFFVSPQDHKIEIPGAVVDKIAKEILVTFKAAYQPLKS